MADERPFHNPFASLAALRVLTPQAAEPAPAAEPDPLRPSATLDAPRAKGPARAVVRMERSGRGGKAVTVVDQLGLSGAQLTEWLKALKATLGCGGAIEGDALVLQGDQRQRLPALLSARGVRKVIVS